MIVSPLLPSNTPALSECLRRRIEGLRSRIIKTNYNTQFVQTVPELTEFRQATAGLIDGVDDATLSNIFRNTVPITRYEAYAPFIARFFENPCKASAIVDLLAPGIPDYLVASSSTSGGKAKVAPKYNRMAATSALGCGFCTNLDPIQKRTRAHLFFLGIDRIDVVDEDNSPIATIYQSNGSAVVQRLNLHLDPEKDGERMGTFVLDHAAPHAAGFIMTWRSFLLIHGLFAVGSRSLETMSMIFINTFVDLVRYLDEEFDMVVECIAHGTIPTLDGISGVRHYLEMNISPDPERAEELRNIGRPSARPGWCGHVWPNLRSISAISSGPFAASIPVAQWFLGPNAQVHAFAYGSAEACLGSPYNPVELNQFKPTSCDIIEFLDVGKDDSISSLAQPWEVEPGRGYEVVVTTQDGLWRYRLGDVVEIAGFDPRDGDPIIQFVERRNVAIRFPDFAVSEAELRAAMSLLAPSLLTKIVNWTTTIDDRRVPATIGFFVELVNDQVPESDLALAPGRVLTELLRLNIHVTWADEHDVFGKPTIRLVRPGTFREFRDLKHDVGGRNFGQVKVPVVLPKAEYVTWILDQVVREL